MSVHQQRLWPEDPPLLSAFADIDERVGVPMVADADAWLKTLAGKSVREQLLERRIVLVKPTICRMHGHMNIDPTGNFSVALNVDPPSEAEIALTLGHEIGHTFSYDLAMTPPKCVLPTWVENRLHYARYDEGGLYQRIEQFCDAFGSKWLSIAGHQECILRNLERVWGISQGTRDQVKQIFGDDLDLFSER